MEGLPRSAAADAMDDDRGASVCFRGDKRSPHIPTPQVVHQQLRSFSLCQPANGQGVPTKVTENSENIPASTASVTGGSVFGVKSANYVQGQKAGTQSSWA